MKYSVHVIMEVSSVVTVEADSPDAAVELAYDSPDMPGSITVGAFGSASVDDSDWNPYQVTDESGAVVWQERT
jgi:hypothetical protein